MQVYGNWVYKWLSKWYYIITQLAPEYIFVVYVRGKNFLPSLGDEKCEGDPTGRKGN